MSGGLVVVVEGLRGLRGLRGLGRAYVGWAGLGYGGLRGSEWGCLRPRELACCGYSTVQSVYPLRSTGSLHCFNYYRMKVDRHYYQNRPIQLITFC